MHEADSLPFTDTGEVSRHSSNESGVRDMISGDRQGLWTHFFIEDGERVLVMIEEKKREKRKGTSGEIRRQRQKREVLWENGRKDRTERDIIGTKR